MRMPQCFAVFDFRLILKLSHFKIVLERIAGRTYCWNVLLDCIAAGLILKLSWNVLLERIAGTYCWTHFKIVLERIAGTYCWERIAAGNVLLAECIAENVLPANASRCRRLRQQR
jgi:hypothetical protein